MRAYVRCFTAMDPGSAPCFERALRSGELDARHVRAVIGKTPGNGLVNDFTRGYLTRTLADALAAALSVSRSEIVARIPMIFSGGVEGVLCPHFTVLAVDDSADDSAVADLSGAAGRLAVGTAISRPLAAHDIGREAQIAATADAVRVALAEARIERAADVHWVQVKAPCLTAAEIAGRDDLATQNPDRMMALSRAAAAFGVACALGERPPAILHEDRLLRAFDVWSAVASTSSGIEVNACEVAVLGNSPHWAGEFRIAHRVMGDALDSASVVGCLADLGLAAAPQLAPADTARVPAVFVKCEPSRTSTLRGAPHTMWSDGDINAQRHVRGAVGGLVAGVVGHTRLFVSGGAEHQGPDGGGIVAAIARVGVKPTGG
jgi:cyanuric acid amidohydrolase